MKTKKDLLYYLNLLLVLGLLASSLGACGQKQEQGIQNPKIAVFIEGGNVDSEWFRNVALGTRHTVDLALDEYRSQGGKPVEIVYFDIELDPNSYIPVPESVDAAIEQALGDPNIVAIWALTGNSMAVEKLIAATNPVEMPLFVNAFSDRFTKPGFAPGEPGRFYPNGRRNLFRLNMTWASFWRAVARQVKNTYPDARTWYVQGSAAYGESNLPIDIYKQYLEDEGWEMTYETAGKPGDGLMDLPITEETLAKAQRLIDSYDIIEIRYDLGLYYAIRKLAPEKIMMDVYDVWAGGYPAPEGYDVSIFYTDKIFQPNPPTWMSDLATVTEKAKALDQACKARFGNEPCGAHYDPTMALLRGINDTPVLTRANLLTTLLESAEKERDGAAGKWHFTNMGDRSNVCIGLTYLEQAADGSWNWHMNSKTLQCVNVVD